MRCIHCFRDLELHLVHWSRLSQLSVKSQRVNFWLCRLHGLCHSSHSSTAIVAQMQPLTTSKQMSMVMFQWHFICKNRWHTRQEPRATNSCTREIRIYGEVLFSSIFKWPKRVYMLQKHLTYPKNSALIHTFSPTESNFQDFPCFQVGIFPPSLTVQNRCIYLVIF